MSSSRVNEYISIGYHYDANAILAAPLKIRQDETITQAWTKINNKFALVRVQPHTYAMDNEPSNHFKTALLKQDISHQLVPPHCHRDSLSEWEIQTFRITLRQVWQS